MAEQIGTGSDNSQRPGAKRDMDDVIGGHKLRMAGEARRILGKPESFTIHAFSSYELDRLAQNNIADPILLRSLFVSEQVYEGDWYEQIGGSCNVWAVAIALRSMGFTLAEGTPEREFVEALHVKSIDPISEKNDGLYLTDITKTAQSIPNLSVRVSYYRNIGYQNTGRMNSKLLKAEQSIAQTILQHLQQGNRLTASIRVKDFYGPPDSEVYKTNEGHGIAVVGYRAKEGKFIDIQIADPSRGITWVDWGHFFRNAEGFVILEKDNPEERFVV